MSKKRKNRTRADTKESANNPAPSGLLWLTNEDLWKSLKDYVRFDRHPDIKICVKQIAELISSMTIFFMKNTELGDIREKNGFSRILDIEPNRYMTRKTLIYKVVEELLLTGNSILLPKYQKDFLTELISVPADSVSYRPTDDGGYMAMINAVPFLDDEIVHFVYNPVLDEPWRGEGLKPYLNDIISNLTDAQKIKGDYYTKNYKPNIVFFFNADTADFMSEEARSALNEKWLKTKPGDPYMIPGQLIDAKHIPSMSLRDIAINESVELDKKVIAKIFGIPLFMIGIGNFNRAEYNNFIDTTISPIAKGIEQELTRKLVYSPEYYIKFNLESLKAFDLESRISMMYTGKAMGVYNANEIRIQAGYEPKEQPEMNEYTMLENYIPSDKAGKQKKLVGGDDDDE